MLITDVESMFCLFLLWDILDITLEHMNEEGLQRYGRECTEIGGQLGKPTNITTTTVTRTTGMDKMDLLAYLGLLILAGIYRSQVEATTILWNAESGRLLFRATKSLKRFW